MAYPTWPTGVVVSDPIVRPQTSIYGTHFDFMGVGGWMSVPSLDTMYSIPNNASTINADGISSGQRKLGMIIKVTDLNVYYEFDIPGYNSLATTDKLISFADNNNFRVKSIGASGQVEISNVNGLTAALNTKVDKTSITDSAQNDSTLVASAKALFTSIMYSNSGTSIAVGGIAAGTIINNQTVKQVLDLMFAPAFAAGVSSASLAMNNLDPSFNSNNREYGNADLATTLSWSVTKRSNAIATAVIDGTSITLNPAMTVAGLPEANQTGTVLRSIGLNATGVQSFGFAVRDSVNNNIGSTSNSISWYHRRYYGTSATAPADLKTGLSSNTISIYGLSGFSSAPASVRSLNTNYNCAGGKYIYYLYPKNGGTGVLVGFDQVSGGVYNGVNSFSAYTCESVLLMDRFNIQREYYIFYTGYQTGSNINISIP